MAASAKAPQQVAGLFRLERSQGPPCWPCLTVRFSKLYGRVAARSGATCGQRAIRQAATLPGLLDRILAVDTQTFTLEKQLLEGPHLSLTLHCMAAMQSAPTLTGSMP